MTSQIERLMCQSLVVGLADTPAALSKIVGASRISNEEAGLTGAQALHQGRLLEVVEGPAAALEDWLSRLMRDERRSELVVLDRRPVARRQFFDWPMAPVDTAPPGASRLASVMADSPPSPDRLVELLAETVRPAPHTAAPPQPPKPITEAARLQTLHGLSLLDTPDEPAFDLAVQMARALTGAGMAVVSLLDTDRQWFKARLGVEDLETPRSTAFCNYTILQSEVMWVEDARQDARFEANPLVTGNPGIRFYAGAPLRIGEHNIGTLCVFDTVPRSPDPTAAEALGEAAAALSRHIVARSRTLAAQALLSHTTDAALVVDQDGRITLWTGGAEALFGWSADEALGQSLDLVLPDEMADAHRAGFARYMAGAGGRIFGRPIDLKARRRDGAVFPMELTLAGWERGGRREVGALIRDTSVRVEQQARLEAALLDAQAAERTKSRFLATMNHELRTPLNGVLGLGHVLGATDLDPHQKRLLDGMTSSGRDLERMVANIVALSADETDTEAVEFSIAEVVGAAARPFLDKAEAKGLRADVSIQAGAPAAMVGHPGALRDAVTALMDNAVKFTRTGSVRITVDGTPSDVRVSVSDTGEGLDLAQLDRLMRPFEQAENGSTRAHDGAGLGLPLLRKAVRRLGGRLDVSSTIGSGSCFTVCFPYAVKDAAAAA